MVKRIKSPLVLGFRPRSDDIIAFSISVINDLSQGEIASVLPSSTEIFAAWLIGVRLP